MATLINNAGVQHYANKMVLAENRKVGSKSLPTALADIDNLIDEMKTQFDAEYGSALDMELENNENVFSVGTGTNIDKKDDVENSFTDVEIKGTTLVNIYGKGFSDVANIGNGSGEIVDDGYYKLVANGSFRNAFLQKGKFPMKPSTVYTVIMFVRKETLVGSKHFMLSDGTSDSPFQDSSIDLNGIGTYTKKVTTLSDFDSTNFCFRGYILPQATSGELEFKVMLLEGDWTNKPLPQYFEGMKSVGQDDVNGHKIEILSQNKNLLTQDKYETWGNEVNIEYSGNLEKYVECSKTPFKVEPNTTYTFSALMRATSNLKDAEMYVYEYRKGETKFFKATPKHVSTNDILDFKRISYTFTTTSNTDRILLRFDNNGSLDGNTATLTCKEYCLSLGNNVTYVEPKSNKKEILLNEPLRGIPNGIKDTIEKVNGEWKIVRKVGSIVLNGSEPWKEQVDGSTEEFLDIRCGYPTLLNRNRQNGLCDKFNYITKGSPIGEQEGIQLYTHATQSQFIASMSKSRFSTVDSFKEYLAQNHTTVLYELVTPIIEDISPITLQCWKNGTISIDEVLPVESTHTVALNKPAQIKRNIEELTELRNRVKKLEETLDCMSLDQALQFQLLNHSINLDK